MKKQPLDHDDGNGRPSERNDLLTSLPTRDAFCRGVDAALRATPLASHSAALLYLDLDGFKAVNSLHGRAVGDQVLLWVSERFRESARGAALVGRVGGDEFACLLSGCPDFEPVAAMAIEILKAVSAPVRVGALDFLMAPSIGIVAGAAAGTSGTSMLHLAALAMYRARHEKLGFAFHTSARYKPARPMFQFGQDSQ